MEIIPLAILLLVFGIEWTSSKFQMLPNYAFADSVMNISLANIERVFDLFISILAILLFQYLYEWRLLDITYLLPRFSWMYWLTLLIAVDFLYYWYHRLGHELNCLWAIHVLHHQSEEMNFTVGIRNSGFQAIIRFSFWTILPFIGYHPLDCFAPIIFIGTYGVIHHTKFIKNLGVLEYILVTPSTHRVHHGRNPEYLDKNYGAFFVLWDRQFKTYEPEVAPIDYGTTTKTVSNNPYWVHFNYWVFLFRQARSMSKWRNKIKLFFMPPGWYPKDEPFPSIEKTQIAEPEVIPTSLKVYAFLQTLITLFVMIGLVLLFQPFKEYLEESGNHTLRLIFAQPVAATNTQLIILIVFVLLSGFTNSVILELKVWTFWLEIGRLFLILIALPYLLPTASLSFILLTALIVLFFIWWFGKLGNRLGNPPSN